MTPEQREERSIWQLEQAGYTVIKHDGGYRATRPERRHEPEQLHEFATLAELVTFASAIYEQVWLGRKITPSA